MTSAEALKKYGEPEKEAAMVVWVHNHNIPNVPKKIYCNKDLKPLLDKAFGLIVERGFADAIKTWDGCFNIRKKRGLNSMSLHSWGLAIDINAAWNGLYKPSTQAPGLVQCFIDAGFEWGGNWTGRSDPMHFQIK